MTAIQAIEVLKQVKNSGNILSEEVISAITVAISALENIGVDSALDCQQLRSFLAQAIIDFRAIGEHRGTNCALTFVSCADCPLDSTATKWDCSKWILEDEVMPLLGDMKP